MNNEIILDNRAVEEVKKVIGGGSSTMMLDLDKIQELNPDFNQIIDPNTVGCDAIKLFEYVKNGGILAVRDASTGSEMDEVYILYPKNDSIMIYKEHQIFIDYQKVTGEMYTINIADVVIPVVTFKDSGEWIDVPGQGGVQNSFTCDKTYDEIVEMYEQGYGYYSLVSDDTDPVNGDIVSASKENDLYHFEVFPKGKIGTYGIEWDDDNQVFVLWNGIM